MKRICPSALVLAVLGLSTIARAGDLVPFKAHGVATGTAVMNGEEEDISFDISLQVAHQGRSLGMGSYVLKLTDLTFTGQFFVIGANGKDKLSFDAAGFLTPIDDNACLFEFFQTFAVTGTGTGSLAGAVGSGTSTGVFDACTISVDAKFSGSITRPNSGG